VRDGLQRDAPVPRWLELLRLNEIALALELSGVLDAASHSLVEHWLRYRTQKLGIVVNQHHEFHRISVTIEKERKTNI
jgi:hypothetical protein